MAALTLAGIPVRVQLEGATQLEMERVGSESRAYAGGLRSTVRAEKRNWRFPTALMSLADVATLRTAIALGVYVTAGGDLLNGATPTVTVTVQESPYIYTKQGIRQRLTLLLREV